MLVAAKRFLIVAHNSRFLVQFELNNVRLLQQMGVEVHCATNFYGETMIQDAEDILKGYGIVLHQIDIERSPLDLKRNFRAYRQLKSLIKEIGFDGVHCHTPIGGVVGRLAANVAHHRPVMYTAHGFHFYKGCPIKNRLLYETAERFLAHYTDALITINQEDYAVARRFSVRGKAYYVPGVGIDLKKCAGKTVDRNKKRMDLGVRNDVEVYVAVGELIPRKGFDQLIQAFVNGNISNSVLLICGSGKEQKRLQSLIKQYGATDSIRLLGFRKDISEILQASDVFVFPSLQEGLPVALMEAMAFGLPCIASRIRGNVDLLGDEYPFLFDSGNVEVLSRKLKEILNKKQSCGTICKERITAFDLFVVEGKMRQIYNEVFRAVTP